MGAGSLSYCTQQDLVDRYGQARLVQLTDRTNRPASTIDVVVVARAITDASSLIDSYLGKRYQLPLTSVPGVLVTYCAQIAWFLLHGEAADKDSPVRQAYADALTWLGRVSGGLVVIEGADGALQPAGGGQIKTSRPSRVFTRDSMGEF